MFPFDIFFKRKEDERVKQLEKRVEDLERALVEFSVNFRKLASLSLKTGEELENLLNYVKRNEGSAKMQVGPSKKSDDFYN